MNRLSKLNRAAAEKLFACFVPMFDRFEERGVDYCLVGGLAVVAHCLARGADSFRATEDADAMVSTDYENSDFAADYLRVYAADPRFSDAVYKAVFGEDGFKDLCDGEGALANISFVGADIDLDGIDTPSFDVCRTLNGRSISNIKRERLEVLGKRYWVATIDELIDMKQSTIAIYGPDIQTNPRPQDFIDISILSKLKSAKPKVSVAHEDRETDNSEEQGAVR